MGQLNLYKIDKKKRNEFEAVLNVKYTSIGDEKEIIIPSNGKKAHFRLSLYVDIPDEENYVEWNWLTKIFENTDTTTRSNPKGILIIKSNDEVYACTYGYSFLFVDKFCDTDFAFEFARRIEYIEIKTTTLLSPISKKNKVINAYIDYKNLEFDSGESFAKLKVRTRLPEDFDLYSAAVEIGHSIKFNTKKIL